MQETVLGMKDTPLRKKSYKSAIQIVNMCRNISENKKEFALSRQLLKSGTAIGALISESEFAQSRADFANKLHIALKEANESRYWLNLLKDTGYLDESRFNILLSDCNELISILVSSIKTVKNK